MTGDNKRAATRKTRRLFRLTRRNFVKVCAVCGAVAAFPRLAFSTTAEDLAAEADALEEEAAALQEETDALAEEIARLEEEYNETLERYNDAMEAHEAALEAMDVAQGQIYEAEIRIAETQEELSVYSKAIYCESDLLSWWQIITGSTSISDLIKNIEVRQRIIDEAAKLVQEGKDAKAAAEAAYEEYSRQEQIAAEELQNALIAKQELEATQEELQKKYDTLSEELADALSAAEQARITAVEAAAIEAETRSAVSSLAGISTSDWQNPASDKYITSPFGWRESTSSFHYGVDLSCNYEPVYCMADGVCTYSGWFSSGGQAVVVDHGNGIVTWYLHNSELNVSEGDEVTAGQQVAVSGNSGRSTGPHLHFQINVGSTDGIYGTAVDPTIFFDWD